jgi:hypothetical protein
LVSEHTDNGCLFVAINEQIEATAGLVAALAPVSQPVRALLLLN